MQKKKAKPVTPEAVIARRRKDLLDRRDIKSFLTRLAGLILFIYVLFGVVFRLTIVSGDDMKPTLRSGDIALVYCFPSNLWNNDIVSYEANGKVRTGRIVARPGDTVEITEDAKLKVNNGTVSEGEIYYSTPAYDSDVTYPLLLGDNEYFILSDFREGAADSRQFGPVERENIIGKVSTILRRISL
ncbi:MAG: signal peptidase I [Allobaculum sp.]|uniref:signal peptidase I n=1 Tax=Allobaculum sp. TaxID=1872463 RepID=UPI00399BE23C